MAKFELDKATIEWLNAHPANAATLLPEVINYVTSLMSPHQQYFCGHSGSMSDAEEHMRDCDDYWNRRRDSYLREAERTHKHCIVADETCSRDIQKDDHSKYCCLCGKLLFMKVTIEEQ